MLEKLIKKHAKKLEKDAGAGRVEAIREAVHEAVGEVVAGGSSIRLLIRV